MTLGLLLAKSIVPKRPPVTLADHSLDVAACVEMLFGTVENPTSLGRAWCRFFRLESFERFLFNLKLACLFHDLGKATPGFQQVLERQGVQIFRHEYLSAFLLLEEPVKRWLTAHPQVYFPGILAAVAGHHLKASPQDSAFDSAGNHYLFGAPVDPFLEWQTIRMYFEHTDIQQVWEQAYKVLGIPAPLDLPGALTWSVSDIARLKRNFELEADNHKPRKKMSWSRNKEADNSENEARLMRALKAAVIVCDALGSAMPRMVEKDESELSPRRWAEQFAKECFDIPALDSVWIEENIIQPRIQEIEADGRVFEPHDFQSEAACQPARTILLSGCGSGKTLAAWYWIQTQVRHFEARRVIFLYPTRATATEGYRDYVSHARDAAGLLHGTALYDLEGMFTNPDDPRTGTVDTNNDPQWESRQRLYALQHWSKQVFSATVDSFLGFMANSYAAICLLPLLADSILVVDEVHAFDGAMFKALQEFLRHFEIPMLCMTTSLPQNRLKRLRDDLGLKQFPENPGKFKDLERQMAYQRYRLERIETDDAQERVLSAFHTGQGVLWVVNQVDRCQHLARQLQEQLPDKSVICYHSRFRLCDRQKIHQDVIDCFKNRPDKKGLILVTTQVCEMSLDLDADILVTDLAPVPALIQRMGRCCRGQWRIKKEHTGLVLITEPENERPYSPEEFAASRQFLESLLSTGKKISQADLSEALDKMDEGVKTLVQAWTAFIDSGLYSPHVSDSPFRDTDDRTVDAVLSRDIPKYLELSKSKRAKDRARCDGFVVPVPRFPEDPVRLKSHARLLRGRMEAANSYYSEVFGFCKEEVTDYAQRNPCFIV